MKLSVLNRVLLLNMLPKEGSYTTLKILRKLRESLSFSEAETTVLQFVEESGRLTWKPVEVPEKNVEIGPTMQTLVRELLTKLDKESKLTDQHVELFDLFVEEA